mgnify:CR=1 FL=1
MTTVLSWRAGFLLDVRVVVVDAFRISWSRGGDDSAVMPADVPEPTKSAKTGCVPTASDDVVTAPTPFSTVPVPTRRSAMLTC